MKIMPGEFDLISELFAPLAVGAPGAFGLLDDAAVIRPRADRDLVITKDLMVAGVHFGIDDPAELVARKLLRVNLSDLASMGADGIGYVLGFAAPADLEYGWVQRFAAGLAQDQETFGVTLMGGDTVRTPGPLILSLTAFGDVPEGQEIRRSEAKDGDLIMVSGTIGDGALGLGVATGEFSELSKTHRDYLVGRLRLPEPRLRLGQGLRAIAHAAADVSDGLVADLEHICKGSHVGAVVDSTRVPISDAALALGQGELLPRLFTGGDDYELLFTISPQDCDRVRTLGDSLGLPVAEIGRIVAGSDVTVLDPRGEPLRFESSGYKHF
jgi:thiamine-monophosphate kinase